MVTSRNLMIECRVRVEFRYGLSIHGAMSTILPRKVVSELVSLLIKTLLATQKFISRVPVTSSNWFPKTSFFSLKSSANKMSCPCRIYSIASSWLKIGLNLFLGEAYTLIITSFHGAHTFFATNFAIYFMSVFGIRITALGDL